MNSADVKYRVAFNLIPGIGRVRVSLLEKRFGDLAAAWSAGPADLKAAGLDSRSVSSIIEKRATISPDAEMEKLQRQHVKALTWHDPAFPPRLKEIYDVPPVLYVRGTIVPEDEWAISVVGTRKPTAYGREVSAQVSNDLARSKISSNQRPGAWDRLGGPSGGAGRRRQDHRRSGLRPGCSVST